MPIEIKCHQVFLASPGGLTAERLRCRKVFRHHNEARSVEDGAAFYVHAWEDVPGGVGRPQELINSKLDCCDYTLLLFNDRWGTPPDHDSTYSSGTEEEFFRTLELLNDANSPMRDILVLFKSVDPARINDAGPELKSVLDFRARIEASKGLMYEVFDSDDSLSAIVDRKLREWLNNDSTKQPRCIQIPDIHVDIEGLRDRDRQELLDSARTFAANGLLMQAEAAFAAATEYGEPRHILEFGQFMRRTGRLEQAMELTKRVVEDPKLLANKTPEAVQYRVRAMTNIGVIQRQLGKITESVRILKESVQTAETSREPVVDELCYALDNYAWSLIRGGQPHRALECFQRVYDIRAEFGNADHRSQSAINLGRYHLVRDEFDDALTYFAEALEHLKSGSDEHLRANALSGKAETLLRLGQDDEVADLLKEALETNERLHNKRGMSIVHGLWARSLLHQTRADEADHHIREASALVDEISDSQGRGVVALLRATSAKQHGDWEKARALASEAEEAVALVSNSSLRKELAELRESLQDD